MEAIKRYLYRMNLLPLLLACVFSPAYISVGSMAAGVTDPNVTLYPAPLPLQEAGTSFVDPVFGATIRRVSNRSDAGGRETHVYSQLQAFSSDNAYLLLGSDNGFLVRRLSDFSIVEGLDASDWNCPRWHPAQPHVIIHYDGNNTGMGDTLVRVQFTNVDTLITTTVFTFPPEYNVVFVNQSWDEISRDGRWMAGIVASLYENGDQKEQFIFAFDIQNNRLGAVVSLSSLYEGNGCPCQKDPTYGKLLPDWIGVSPLGRYIVLQWSDGTTRCKGLETWDLRTGNFVGRVYDGHQHGDLGVDVDGTTEYFITFEMEGGPVHGQPSIGKRVLPGNDTVAQPTHLMPINWGLGQHISCRGPNGTVLVTCGVDPFNNTWEPFEDELFFVRTNGSVLRFVHTRSSACGYWSQPHASISRDGRYVVFASDWCFGRGISSCDKWGDELGAADAYIIDLQ